MNDYHPLPKDDTDGLHTNEQEHFSASSVESLQSPARSTNESIITTKNVAIALIGLLLVSGATRALVNQRDAKALQDYTTATLERTVLTTKAKPGALQQNLRLPTSLRGNTEAVIYARTNGYVSNWHKGIGDYVKRGELLATLDTPEQEQELAQARAQREQIAAQLEFAEKTLARWDSLAQRESAISPQDLDEKRSLVRQTRADLNAADANVKRLGNVENFRHIRAPFDGIVTRRSIEVGDYVAQGSKELFAITQTDPLRASIWVPQSYADGLRLNAEVELTLREQQGPLEARIERIAGGIDPGTRSRQVDLLLPNPNATLLPGAYAEVNIPVTSSVETLVVPAATLIIRDQYQRIAVVEPDNKISFRNVKLGRDLGRDVEVLEGISTGDTLVVSPPDQLVEDELVKTLAWKPAAPANR
ncbi:efflux RND transporter periplasmic adaptor subunit [Cellvibrio mixtus]|uniref:efflux RND transporter periplasmic adaptor subunit n=1 Tax=Cellvibrio mixtus TaxID=39650 RepID=UPI000A04932F|nr:efflux RND transporter periplasmic adaptor subunit [Cellvibrio mixtus]